MPAFRTAFSRRLTSGHPKARPVPPAGRCRSAFVVGIGFATLVPLLAPVLPAAAGYRSTDESSANLAAVLDADGNGVEDILDAWAAGRARWDDLRDRATAAADRARAAAEPATATAVPGPPGPWARGEVRLVWVDGPTGAASAAANEGGVKVVHDLPGLGVQVLSCDAPGLAALLKRAGRGRLMLDRDGVPALDVSRGLVGADRVRGAGWNLGRDWSVSVAILDSGCDTAHGDLGDPGDDDIDGPAPAVGDAGDWASAEPDWPLLQGYKVVGWADVTDDFPQAVGPWDYHYHGTALASAVAGSGSVSPAYAGVAPSVRLTVVKFYDFDVTWHAWAGDFVAACAWLLEHGEANRVRAALAAVTWDADAGIAEAMAALLDAGIPVIAAAGNDGAPPAVLGWPARVPGVLTVGGVDDECALAAFSSRGPVGGGKPDLVAPSGGLLADAGRITCADNEPNDAYLGRFGTSLAAAHAAGAVALLDEALADRGLLLPPGRESALLRGALLKATAQPITEAESADGLGTMALPRWDGPDHEQGWGVLRIDAAVAAACFPLAPGVAQVDTLSLDWSRPTAARRLVIEPGVAYTVEAVPSAALDIIVEVIDPRGMVLGRNDGSARRDAGGPGATESLPVAVDADRWLSVVVKRRSGAGTVTLRLREDAGAVASWKATLPGRLTGAPNVGTLGQDALPSVVVPSLVAVDDVARSIAVFDADGAPRPGWPVYLFPPVSAEGGFGQPLVWDLDGLPGDEIVATSAYGSIVFLDAAGGRTSSQFAFNVALTVPVGLVSSAGRRCAAVDATGLARVWSAGGVLQADRALGHPSPLAPAAGVLQAGADESLVVAFADGHVRALDAQLQDRAGWPRDLGAAIEVPPVLVDTDGDGASEIVIVVRGASTGLALLRVLDGLGNPAAGDGAALATPDGGPWVRLAPPAVTGRYGAGDLGVSVVGLAAGAGSGDEARWMLAEAVMLADGSVQAARIAGLEVGSTTSQGRLVMDRVHLPAPLAWNRQGGTGTECGVLVGLWWSEVLTGLTSIPGAALAWYQPGAAADPLASWRTLQRGAAETTAPQAVGSALLPRGDGSLMRLDVVDTRVTAVPLPDGGLERPLWTASRGDGRNSGSYPLDVVVSGLPPAAPGASALAVYPNPGAGRFAFSVGGFDVGAEAALDVYDVRGRRVRTLRGPLADLRWDGRTADGRSAAAGTYFAVVRTGQRSWTARFVLAR